MGERHKKRLAKLRYKDKILQLHEQGKTLKEIAQIINYSLVRTNLKTTLSPSSIYRIIQKYKGLKQWQLLLTQPKLFYILEGFFCF